MAQRPIIFALANPTPEIMPEEARAASPPALIATGRSDHPNQANNVLCFPFIFRGGLDVGATGINEAMKVVCVEAIAGLARAITSAEMGLARQGERLTFGRDYPIPKPFDLRLLPTVAVAVAKAAMDSGVAARGLDLDAYRQGLQGQVYRSALIMRPVFEAGRDFDLANPESDARFRDYWASHCDIMRRKDSRPTSPKAVIRTNTTAIAAVRVQRDEADSPICGTVGRRRAHLRYVREALSTDMLRLVGALSLILLDKGPLFVADSHATSIRPGPSSPKP